MCVSVGMFVSGLVSWWVGKREWRVACDGEGRGLLDVCGSARRVMCELRGAGRCSACGIVVCEVAVYGLEACVIAGYGAAGEWNGRVAVVWGGEVC